MFIDYRRVEDYPDYIISNTGIVYSTKRGKVIELKPGNDKDCYKLITLCKDGKQKTFRIHTLVGNAFVGKREGGMTYDHIDRNKSNNRADNIRLATKSEQGINKNMHKNNKIGEKNIHNAVKGGYEYFCIQIRRNKKRVFLKLLNKKKYTLEDVIKVRDDFLKTL